jgi:hypothetical protein
MSNQPISEQYRLVAKKWVDAEAAASILEESKSAFLSRLMSNLGDISVSKAEMTVKASNEWQEYIEGMVTARQHATLLKVQLEYLRMRFQEWNSENATRRAEIRLTQ